MLQLSDIALPIIQAPMAGGLNTVEQVAIVSNAGGIGSFGFAYSTPDKIVADLQAVKSRASGPVNANFFIFSPVQLPAPETCDAVIKAMSQFPGMADCTLPQPPFYPDLQQQLEAIWQEKPALLTFHFGIPPRDIVDKAHAHGIAVGMTATCLSEAKQIVMAGADIVIAQGIEAGGHRGLFNILQYDEQLTTFALVRELAQEIKIPIVTAGGIMSGYDIRKAFACGATAVQMGTAFLTCHESGTPPAYKDYLLKETQRGTALTTAYSGRPARGIVTEFIQQMEGQSTLPFPIQNTLTREMRQQAQKRNDAEYQSLWAGTHYPLCRDESTTDLLDRLKTEMVIPAKTMTGK
jgi:nitronate monooxygenase